MELFTRTLCGKLQERNKTTCETPLRLDSAPTLFEWPRPQGCVSPTRRGPSPGRAPASVPGHPVPGHPHPPLALPLLVTTNWLGSPFLETRCLAKSQHTGAERSRGINLLLEKHLKRRARGKRSPGHTGAAGAQSPASPGFLPPSPP